MRGIIDVTFEHWKYTFPDGMLSRYGSRYFSRKEAGQAYASDIHGQAEPLAVHQLDFQESQILCGNEAFPEAAVADPISDLQVWDEWTSGIRDFPYPGRYSRLGITRQEEKVSSPASVGVLGEVMAGFFAQAGVSPWVLVRGVRRWPDFIFAHPGDGSYSFVESKAFTGQLDVGEGLRSRIPPALLMEGVINASQELTSDPSGRIWCSFTRIGVVTPLCLAVTFLELAVSEEYRKAHKNPIMPAAVTDGLAERAVNQAAVQMGLEEPCDLLPSRNRGFKDGLRELQEAAEGQVEDLLREAGTRAAKDEDRLRLSEAVERVLHRVAKSRRRAQRVEESRGRRLSAAKQGAADSLLSKLWDVGGLGLYLADLPRNQQDEVRTAWCRDWTRANKPWGRIREANLWRCGGAVFCLGHADVDGLDIREAKAR
jgi:hypothetical protein